MSLIKKLWIVLSCITLGALMTAATINLMSAQRYLENELRIKNLDAATALALTISQTANDDITAGLLVSSQFDLGHYRLIEFLAPDGRVALRRERSTQPAGVPAWFVQLVPIHPEPGEALIQSGWRQLGVIRLQSDPSFAYDSLWTSVRALSGLFLAGCIILGILGTLFIRSIIRPLKRVVEQAQALVHRRYVEIKPPSTLEFRHIIEALNRHTRKTKDMLDEESRRLDQLKTDYERDHLTGLLVREVFLRHVQTQIRGEQFQDHGCLILLRMDNLMELNESLGRLQVDELIQQVVTLLRSSLAHLESTVLGRLGARDIGILLPGETETASIKLQIQSAMQQDGSLGMLTLRLGSAVYAPGMAPGDLLHACDADLRSRGGGGDSGGELVLRSAQEWSRILDLAFAEREWRLAVFPVRSQDQQLLFHDGFARIESRIAGRQLAAGAFLPWATRRGLVAEIDLEMLRLALEHASQSGESVCVNLGYQSVCDERIQRRTIELIRSHPAVAERLLFDIPEAVAFGQYTSFEHFCRRLMPLGCRIGIEHLDRQLGHVGRLHGLGIHHLKISAALTAGIEKDLQSQSLLRGLCTVAHALGLQVIAEGVADAADLPVLYGLGFDGAGGPAVG